MRSSYLYFIIAGLLAVNAITLILYVSKSDSKAEAPPAVQNTTEKHDHHEEEHFELAVTMGHLQRFADKLYFAGTNQNWKLASFYVEEMEESAEEVEKAKITEDGKNVSLLIGQMLLPQLKALDQAVTEQSLPKFQEVYKAVVNNCNACHGATNHDFIQITVPQEPTYRNQDFKVKGKI